MIKFIVSSCSCVYVVLLGHRKQSAIGLNSVLLTPFGTVLRVNTLGDDDVDGADHRRKDLCPEEGHWVPVKNVGSRDKAGCGEPSLLG